MSSGRMPFSCDFLKLNESIWSELSETERSFLSGDWNSQDEDFVDIFQDVVERHYHEHLQERRINLVGFLRVFDKATGKSTLEKRVVRGPGDADGLRKVFFCDIAMILF